MAQYGRRRAWTILTLPALLCGFLLAADPLAAQAEETETRDFRVKIDDKPAGSYHMTIKRNGDGTVVMTAQGAAKVSILIFGYTYSYQGTEVWKDGRLWQLNSKANDDGKKYVVSAAATDKELRVTTNGKSRSTRWDVWTTTYWHAPDAKFRGQIVPLLDADTGKDINSNLELVGAGPLEVAAEVQNCTHYRLTGGVKVDLWYDAQDRLVRQEGVEDGHRTLFELVRIRR